MTILRSTELSSPRLAKMVGCDNDVIYGVDYVKKRDVGKPIKFIHVLYRVRDKFSRDTVGS